jgi:hypothetical protein
MAAAWQRLPDHQQEAVRLAPKSACDLLVAQRFSLSGFPLFPNSLWILENHNDRFAAETLPRYFSKKSKFTSFTRKLNRWNFTRVTRGPES